MTSLRIPIDRLVEHPYANLLTYPRSDDEEIIRRIKELREFGVGFLRFEGRTKIGSLGILGKGCVSIAVKAEVGRRLYAIKIRRVDANRPSLRHEADMHRIANNLRVGPELYKASENFLLMELAKGWKISEWIKKLKGKGSASSLRKVLKEVMDQCHRLDLGGLDHGELSNLKSHIVVGKNVFIIDFESAGTERRISNLTSASQYLFVGGFIAKKVRKIIGIKSLDSVLNSLREYKFEMNRNTYQALLRELKLI